MRKNSWILSLALVALAPTAEAIEFEHHDFSLQINALMRVRGLFLFNGTRVEMLDPETRLGLVQSGEEELDESRTYLDTRLRLTIASAYREVLEVVTQLEIGDIVFGEAGTGGGMGTDGLAVEVKLLYLHTRLLDKSLSLKGGLMTISQPKGLILYNDAAAVNASYQVGWAKIYAFYIAAVESSRQDLDEDGFIDNEFNDRTIASVGVQMTPTQILSLEAYGTMDLDWTQDFAEGGDMTRNNVWLGLSVGVFPSNLSLDLDLVYNYGRGEGEGMAPQNTHAFAADLGVQYDFRFMRVRASGGYATGPDPNSPNTGFQTISAGFQVSDIIYDTVGGFSITGGSLAGTAYGALKLTTSVADLEISALALYAAYTAKPLVEENVLFVSDPGQGLGWEFNVDLTYHVFRQLKLFLLSGVMLPGEGYGATMDSLANNPIVEVMAGAQASL